MSGITVFTDFPALMWSQEATAMIAHSRWEVRQWLNSVKGH